MAKKKVKDRLVQDTFMIGEKQKEKLRDPKMWVKFGVNNASELLRELLDRYLK